MPINTWFEVDKDGLRKLLENREKHHAIFELVQNAWDTDATEVKVTLEPVPSQHKAQLVVEDDDPNGFLFLEHAYTLFAESVKKGDPEKRGRFNLGEKLVLALCEEADVASTKGHIIFNANGTRERKRTVREKGSIFRATIKMSREEIKEAIAQLKRLIPRKGIRTTINGELLGLREDSLVATFEATLPTVIANEEGVLTRSKRKTTVNVYSTQPGEPAAIYELGIPVVETEDQYIIDVQQKVPLTMDRDNVPPAYARQLRALVLNATADRMDSAEAKAPWVTDALHHPDVAAEAVTQVLDHRFGTKRAIFDPTDLEANNRLTSEGYKVIHGGTFGSEAWDNIREAGAALPSGQIRPTHGKGNPPPEEDVPKKDWSEGMRKVVELTHRVAEALLEKTIDVRIVRTKNSYSACYGGSELRFNLRALGRAWFDRESKGRAHIIDLILHELAHEYESNHLSDGYYKALSAMGGKLTELAAKNPKLVLE